MRILKNEGNFEILATWPSNETNTNAQMVIERAGRTCYQSEKGEITPETAAKFTAMVMKRGHYSVIEHAWRGYVIQAPRATILEHFWPFTKFMFITDEQHPGVNETLVSANLETWRKCLVNKKLGSFTQIWFDLVNFAPEVFNCCDCDTTNIPAEEPKVTPITSINQLVTDQERLVHITHTTRYNNCSRGVTHELVRHRVPVFSQESTRYVNESDLNVVVPPHRLDDVVPLCKGVLPTSVSQWFAMNEAMYGGLLKLGWRPEDARQVLPTAIKAQIVMSCNLEESKWIYRKRCDKTAHWEIRAVMCQELQEMKLRYPELFKGFTFIRETVCSGQKEIAPHVFKSTSEYDINYAQYRGPAEHFSY